jgi:hypothetical protein
MPVGGKVAQSTYSQGCLVVIMKIPQTMVHPVTLLVLLENPWWIVLHYGGFVMFKPVLFKLLNIEYFVKKYWIKINYGGGEGDWATKILNLEFFNARNLYFYLFIFSQLGLVIKGYT